MATLVGHLFQGMTEDARREIGRIGKEETHAEGDFLFNAGDPALNLAILVEGRVRVGEGIEGRVAHISSGSGDSIGWSSMAGNDVHWSSAECLSTVKVLRFNRDELDQLLQRDTANGMAFFRRLSQYIAARLAESYGGMLSLQQKHGHPYSFGG
jgi:CRP-like cAMP-binding protein